MPFGKRGDSPATVRSTSFATFNAFAPGCRNTPTSVAALPLMRPMKS
jgi:hypothetical protein